MALRPAIHSFTHSFIHPPTPPGGVLSITPYHKADNWSAGWRKPPRLIQSRPCYSCTKEFCLRLLGDLAQHINSRSYAFGQHTPLA